MMIRKLVLLTMCMAVGTLALGCSGAGGGGDDEKGKKAIQDAAAAIQKMDAEKKGK
jgi:hypothetical protein